MRGTTRARPQNLLAVLGLALLALACGFFFWISESTRARGAKMLEGALAQLEQQQDYNLAIVEKAPPHYELSFRGSMEKGSVLKGVLPDFDLEVLLQKEELQLRRENSTEWLEPDTLELEGLSGFLVSPLELLRAGSNSFSGALRGEEVTLEQLPCETVYFILSEPEELAQRLFPAIDYAEISRMVMGAALVKSDLRVKQLRILVDFAQPGREQIERIYYLN